MHNFEPKATKSDYIFYLLTFAFLLSIIFIHIPN